ncbi:uncharacterized protein LOC134460284 [Engraulis encrasicolus]|uniref:uncharacterized protein LOC134460284 n=1 Tax=Engraulis encrasicolus TaxID=184585 RepID=UPI002FD5989C
MDRFPPALLEELRPAVQRDIRLILEAVEEEYIRQNAAWKNTVRHGDEQNRRLTAALEAAEAARLQERERLQASIRQLNQQLQEVKRQASLIRADQASQTATGQAMISTMGRHLQELQDQLEKEKRQALESQNEMVMEIEKMREQIKRERERRVDLLFIQRRRVMDELQQQAARWMQLKHQPGLLLSVCEAQRLQKKLKRIPSEESCVGEAAGKAKPLPDIGIGNAIQPADCSGGISHTLKGHITCWNSVNW